MDAKELIRLRKQAEKAVAQMPDGELKVKAFEVILAYLLGSGPSSTPTPSSAALAPGEKRVREGAKAKSTSGRILVLRDEGFFQKQRTISEVREELKAHGWHYPLTALSGTLQNLIRQRKLRRERATQGKKKVWKYSNP